MHSDYEADEKERARRWREGVEREERRRREGEGRAMEEKARRELAIKNATRPQVDATEDLIKEKMGGSANEGEEGSGKSEEVAWELPGETQPTFYGAPGTQPKCEPVPPRPPSLPTSYPEMPRPRPVPDKSKPCSFFLKGSCRYGSSCMFSHNIPAPPPIPSSPSSSPTCNICYDPITNRFGYLKSCSHTFHLTCIQSWRREGEAGVAAVRSCPVCRAPSDYVLPSDRKIEGEKMKAALDTAYRQICGGKDCKLFDFGKGNCPFGSSCLYRHLDESGRAVVGGFRTKVDDEGIVGGIGGIKLSGFLDGAL